MRFVFIPPLVVAWLYLHLRRVLNGVFPAPFSYVIEDHQQEDFSDLKPPGDVLIVWEKLCLLLLSRSFCLKTWNKKLKLFLKCSMIRLRRVVDAAFSVMDARVDRKEINYLCAE